MREILFRGQRIDNGEWVEGCLVHRSMFYGEPCDNYFILCDGEFHCDYYNAYEVIPETIGQYTGLTDKNGKKIFEGDVVKVKTSSNDGTTVEITRVGYDIKFCGFFPMRWEESCDGCDCYFRIEEIEIIGNIHDNPELLKEREQ